MKKVFLLFIFSYIFIVSPAIASDEITFSVRNKSQILSEYAVPVIYKPLNLIIGQNNTFIVKGEPGSNVSLAVSDRNSGAPDLFGHKLRLGDDIHTVESVIPQNGIAKVDYFISKDQNKEKYYIEAAVWKKADLSDFKLAKIIAENGSTETDNGIAAVMPAEKNDGGWLSPLIDGTTSVRRTMDVVDSIQKNQAADEYYDMNAPAIIKNIHFLKQKESLQ